MRDQEVLDASPVNAQASQKSLSSFANRWRRRAAAGKALIAYLATGSIGTALVVYLIFKGMHC